MAKSDGTTSSVEPNENLPNNPAYVSEPENAGRLLYEYSNAYTEFDMSLRRRRQARKSPFGIVLPVFSTLLVLWYFESLIYGLVTENNFVDVLMQHLFSLFIVVICDAILLLSYFGAWGKLFRLTYRKHAGKNVWERRHNAGIYNSMKQADKNLPKHTTIAVTENYVLIWLYGIGYAFDRSQCRARIEISEALRLTLLIGDDELEFPLELPENDLFEINRAFGKRTQIMRVRNPQETGKNKFGGDSLGSVISGTVFACIIVAGGGALIALSLTDVPSMPTFFGVVIVGFGALALCNVYHYITFVSKALLPFITGLILIVGVSGLLFLIERELSEQPLTIISLLTHCAAHRAACVFFIFIGIYAVTFSITKAVQIIKYR